jgi:hypothetical protein
MPCSESTARTHLRTLPRVAASPSLIRSLSELLAENAADAQHAARAVAWLKEHVLGETTAEDVSRALRAVSASRMPDRRPSPGCHLCFGTGYVGVPPVFRDGQTYSAVRECSCWEVIA